MSIKSEIPKFETGADEAQWWFDHRDDTAALMEEAAVKGQTTSLSAIVEKRQERGVTPTLAD